ncbi:RNA-binding protein with multiple splicing 2b isoform X2 [Ctenopharyngodon idella]|uniref:RNA-binding protein with multiple splicing 2b isoform X2 n=1 Tax=Ctenopharyngodon idella TaxID=7959 RepID=UPI0022317F03|nr:RNA-binding protein with multiple splicing 2b isoform X2 [Ctenopharyngodon idella]
MSIKSDSEPNNNVSIEEEVRTLFVSGLPTDIKPRELYLLFRPFKGYEGSLIKLTSKQPVGFVTFDSRSGAEAAKNALNCVVCVHLFSQVTEITRDHTDDLTGATLIPASPEAWSPYPLYTPELSPGLPHTAFTYPAAAAAAAAALHAQMRWYPSTSDSSQPGWKSRQFC